MAEGAPSGRGFDDFEAVGREPVEVGLQVAGGEGDVVQPRTPPSEEAAHAGVRREGFDEFEAGAHEGHTNPLIREQLGGGTPGSDDGFEERNGRFERIDGQSDMMDR